MARMSNSEFVIRAAAQALSDDLFWRIWPKPKRKKDGTWHSFHKGGVGFVGDTEQEVLEALLGYRADMSRRSVPLIWC